MVLSWWCSPEKPTDREISYRLDCKNGVNKKVNQRINFQIFWQEIQETLVHLVPALKALPRKEEPTVDFSRKDKIWKVVPF